jgi:tight adherence protein B
MTSMSASGPWGSSILFAAAVLGALLFARLALASARSNGLLLLLGETNEGPRKGQVLHSRLNSLALGPAWRSLALGGLMGWLGLRLIGGVGLAAGMSGGSALPFLLAGRRRRRNAELLERQVAEVAESAALAVRSGLSILQAVQFAATEVSEPARKSVQDVLRTIELGTPFDPAVKRWANGIGSDEARLLALVLTIHSRSGGDLAGALDEVARTIRHRVSVQRELKAMSAQGRVSGAVLGSLPIAFFLVLATTSRSEVAPVYRSAAGASMVAAGLVLELVAYLWIRRLLRVEI